MMGTAHVAASAGYTLFWKWHSLFPHHETLAARMPARKAHLHSSIPDHAFRVSATLPPAQHGGFCPSSGAVLWVASRVPVSLWKGSLPAAPQEFP